MPAPPRPYIAKISRGTRFLGSGVLVTPRMLLTCEHVVEQVTANAKLKVLVSGVETEGSILAKDENLDLALVELYSG